MLIFHRYMYTCVYKYVYIQTAVRLQANFTNEKGTWAALYFVSYEKILSDSFF